MLDGLDRIDWTGLQHAYGPATDIPAALRAIALGGRSQAAQALNKLADALCHQGSRYTATVAAIPYIVELAQRRGPCVAGLLRLLHAIAAPTCDQILRLGLTEQQFHQQMARTEAEQTTKERDDAKTYGVSPQVDAQCHAQIAAALPDLLPIRDTDDPATLSALLALCGEFPASWSLVAPLLTDSLATPADPALHRSAMAALGRLGQSVQAGPVDPLLRDWLSPRHALPLRAEAALAMTTQEHARYDTLCEALRAADTLFDADTSDRAVIPHSGWTAHRVAACLARWRGNAAQDTQSVTAILAALPLARSGGASADPLLRAALTSLARGAPIEGMFRGRKRSTLSDLDRQVLNAILTYGPWQIGDSRNGTFAALLRRCGLPDTPQEMARYASPPGAFARLLRR